LKGLVDQRQRSRAYADRSLSPKKGDSSETWDAYGQDLRENLEDLLRRFHSGAYRASPSRRVYIPKPDGRQRPLGIATLEDKILQRAVVEVLNAVPTSSDSQAANRRSLHDALDAVALAPRSFARSPQISSGIVPASNARR